MTCSNCGKSIPLHRHGNSPYCSNECSYEVKRGTSHRNYHQKKDFYKVFQNLQGLLLKYHDMQRLGFQVKYEDLKVEGFNFGFSTDECLGPNKEPCKVIGLYAYYLNTQTKIVSIWKLNISQSPNQ